MDKAADEFSIEAIEQLISDAERTVRSVRNSLRAREPSPVRRPIQVLEILDNSQNESQEPAGRQVEDLTSGSANSSGNSDSKDNMGVSASSSEESASSNAQQAAVPPPIVVSTHSNSFDDEVILVSETKNTNPVTIDLCSPDVGNFGHAPRLEDRKRRRRCGAPPDEGPPPQRAATDEPHPHLKCVICMEDMRARLPTSTICGHVFCNQCITTAIKVSKRCPICRKILNLRGIHPLYLFSN